MNDLYQLNSLAIKGMFVKVVQVNLKENEILKLDQIGLFIDQVIYVLEDSLKNITRFKINNVCYAIRSVDAQNIIVKKEQ